MARELVILDQQPNHTLRVAFLLPVPQVTRISKQTEGMTVPYQKRSRYLGIRLDAPVV